MESLGLNSTESCRPYYQMKEGKEYSVYFGITLGESHSYSLSLKLWQQVLIIRQGMLTATLLLWTA